MQVSSLGVIGLPGCHVATIIIGPWRRAVIGSGLMAYSLALMDTSLIISCIIHEF